MLQTTAVFTNVSKGILAKHEDLADVFGTQDEEQICIRILNEGDYQAKPCFTDMVHAQAPLECVQKALAV